MSNFAFFIEMKAKPGKEAEVEAFLKKEASLVKGEPTTLAWTAAKDEAEPGLYRVFDTFHDEAGREAHMNGEAGQEFVASANDLFVEAKIHRLRVVAEK